MVTIVAVIPLAVALALMTLLQRNSRQAGLVTLVLVCALAWVVPAFHLSPLHLLLRTCGPLVLWTITLHMLLLASILTPSPLVLGGVVVLLLLPCVPRLRPIFLALPAR